MEKSMTEAWSPDSWKQAEARHLPAYEDQEALAAAEEALASHPPLGFAGEARALKDVHDATVDIALAATARVIAESLDETRAAKLVDAAIKDLGQRLNYASPPSFPLSTLVFAGVTREPMHTDRCSWAQMRVD